ncbi:MAG: DUF1634 domain-containing protein [Chloroflexota bacterium]
MESDSRLYAWVRVAFWAGLVVSLGLIVAGFIWLGVGDGLPAGMTFGRVPSLAAGDPAMLVTLGVLVLLATPAVVVLLAAVHFVAARETAYVVVSLAIVAMLALSVVLGLL